MCRPLHSGVQSSCHPPRELPGRSRVVPGLQWGLAMHINVRWRRAAPVVLLLLLAGPVSAQPAYAPEAAGSGQPSPVDERPSQGDRIAAELGLGVVSSLGLGVGGSVGGGLIGLVLCFSSPGACSRAENPLETGMILGGSAGVGLGVPIGVWWGGKVMGGNGTFNGALAGSSLSLALSGVAYALKQEDLAAGLLLTAPFFAVAGYELTDSDPQPQDAAPATVAPAIGLGAGGARFGLQGTF